MRSNRVARVLGSGWLVAPGFGQHADFGHAGAEVIVQVASDARALCFQGVLLLGMFTGVDFLL